MDKTRSFPGIFVYEWPVRLWHWINACCIVVLAITGYLIGHPPMSVVGEASDHFIMGYPHYSFFYRLYFCHRLSGENLLGHGWQCPC